MLKKQKNDGIKVKAEENMEERRRAILREVEEKGKVRVADLSRRFGCSEVTIRNDIRNMDAEGLLVRTHGGAVKLEK